MSIRSGVQNSGIMKDCNIVKITSSNEISIGDIVVDSKLDSISVCSDLLLGIVYKKTSQYVFYITESDSSRTTYDFVYVVRDVTEELLKKIVDTFNSNMFSNLYKEVLYNSWAESTDAQKKKFAELIEIQRCKYCGSTHISYVYNNTETGEKIPVCDNCFSSYFYNCDRCGDIELIENAEKNTPYLLCKTCQARDYVLPYHRYYPPLKFYKKNDDDLELYLGVELEIDGAGESNDTVELINRYMNKNDHFVYCSHDGSLNEGLEIITQPATLAYHMSIVDKYETLFKQLISMGYSSDKTTTCGIHVHFNRDFYKDNEELYISKLLYLIDKNWDNVVLFSRRNQRKIDRYAKKLDMDTEDFIYESNKRNRHDYHYYAINLSNENTIEFRMFKGSLNINTFIAILQFVQSCIICAKTKSPEEIQHMDFNELMNTRMLKNYWKKRVEKDRFEE